MSEVKCYETDYGFVMGAATVTRIASMPDGTVVVRVAGVGDAAVDVYVSPGGRSVRVFGKGKKRGEWRPAAAAPQGLCATPDDCKRGEPCMLAAGCSNDPRTIRA